MPSPGRNHNNGADLLLYTYPNSFYCQKVVMAMHLKNLKYKTHLVDIYKGKQYNDNFLSLNPRGEVPVLVDDVRHIVDSEKIIEYLEDNFSNGSPRLRPEEPEQRKRCDQLSRMICDLKVQALTYGAIKYDDLRLNPKDPFDNINFRSQLADIIDNKLAAMRSESTKRPQFADTLDKKLIEYQKDSTLWNDREAYELLLIKFEKVLDECEADLSCQESPDWWICSPKISIADIHLGILLYQLWILGFERRMWEHSRPNVKRYLMRIQRLDSFQEAVKVTPPTGLLDVLRNPYVLGFLGTTAIIGGGYYIWNKNGRQPLDWNSLKAIIFSGETNKEPSPPPATTLRPPSAGNKISYSRGSSGSSNLHNH